MKRNYFSFITGHNVSRCICLVILVLAGILSSCSSAYAQHELKGNIPDLCYDCHKDLKKGLADTYTHFLFKQGKCTSCHNPHVSNVTGLMIDDVNALCLRCHKEINKLIEANIHGALRSAQCTECHNAHSGKNAYLLSVPEKDMCLDCHKDLKKQAAQAYACKPFREGTCSACHNSHGSVEENLLIDNPVSLCSSCHEPKCKFGEHSITSIVKGSDCTSCHSGHAADKKGLLGPYGHSAFLEKNCSKCHNPISETRKITTKIKGVKLCLSCHSQEDRESPYREDDVHVKDLSNPCTLCHDHHGSDMADLTKNETALCLECHETIDRRISVIEKSLKEIDCTPVRDRKCFACHIPMHSDRQFSHRGDGIELCARCHTAQHKVSHPVGADVIDPRSGGAVTCLSCHSMHGAGADFFLTHDRKRTLCIQCHKEKL